MPRVTIAMVRVARALTAETGLSGAEMSRRCSILGGTLYPLLQRMEDAGWVTSRWEAGDPKKLGRPLRRFYDLTENGAEMVVL